MKKYSDIIIIGGGIAGITCAMQLKLNNINSIIIERENIGGIINYAYSVYNIPFLEDSVNGRYICNVLKKALKNRNITIVKDNVKCIKKIHSIYEIIANNRYRCKYIVIASGTKPKELLFSNNRILYIPVRNKLKNKDIVIYGGGDIAFDYALSINEYANVKIIMRTKVKANRRLIDMVNKKNILFLENTLLIDIKRYNNKLKLYFKKEDTVCDYLIPAIGRIPNIGFANNVIDKNNVFIIGDAKGHKKYIAYAMNDAIKTAEIIKRSLYENETFE